MSECKKCGSQSSTFIEGISKKTNKPWKANKCDNCGEMNWIATPKAPNGNFQKSAPSNSTLEAKIDKILAILKENFPPVTTEATNEEESPF